MLRVCFRIICDPLITERKAKLNRKFWRIYILLLAGIISFTYAGSDDSSPGWVIPFDGSVSAPVLTNGMLYIGSRDGSVYALNPENGEVIWRFDSGTDDTRGPHVIQAQGDRFEDLMEAVSGSLTHPIVKRNDIEGTPVIKDNTLFIGSRNHRFFAIDPDTGTLKWAVDLGLAVRSTALVTDNLVLVFGSGIGGDPDVIFALGTDDGATVWTTIGRGSASYPYLSGGTLYFTLLNDVKRGSGENLTYSLHAVDVKTGKSLYETELTGNRPQVFGSSDVIYVSDFVKKGKVPNARNNGYYEQRTAKTYAIEAGTGELLWTLGGGEVDLNMTPFHTEVDLYMAPILTIDSRRIYSSTRHGLTALDRSTGERRWFTEGKFSPYNRIVNQYLFVRGDPTRKDNHLYAIDPASGEIVWRYKGKNMFFTLTDDERVYLSTEQSLVSLDRLTGKRVWKFKTGSWLKAGTNVSAIPLLTDDKIIFPTETQLTWGEGDIQGHLYCIDLQTGKLK